MSQPGFRPACRQYTTLLYLPCSQQAIVTWWRSHRLQHACSCLQGATYRYSGPSAWIHNVLHGCM